MMPAQAGRHCARCSTASSLAGSCYGSIMRFVATSHPRPAPAARRPSTVSLPQSTTGHRSVFSTSTASNGLTQQFFNAFVFKTQQAEYEAEGIEWSFVTFRDNDDVLDAIEQNMVPLLDDQCRMPSGSDSGYVASLRAALLPANRFRESRRDPDSTFTVVHFAGAVEYTAKGFCEKNKEVT